jgi:hypothetical protein
VSSPAVEHENDNLPIATANAGRVAIALKLVHTVDKVFSLVSAAEKTLRLIGDLLLVGQLGGFAPTRHVDATGARACLTNQLRKFLPQTHAKSTTTYHCERFAFVKKVSSDKEIATVWAINQRLIFAIIFS